MNRRSSFEGARCLVTGASSGLGRAIAEHLVRAGASVLLTGRSLNQLEAIARALVDGGARPEAVLAIDADLTEDEGRSKVVHAAADRFGALDLVVNTAGVGASGHLDTHASSVMRQVFEINVFALIELTRAVLPLLRQGDRPSLVNLGSLVTRKGFTGCSEYSASKFAVAGFTESIRAEWSKFGIHVLLLDPGFTSTEFEKKLIVETSLHPAQDKPLMSLEHVARKTLQAIRQGNHEVTIAPKGWLLLLVNRLTSWVVDQGFARLTRRLFQDVVLTSDHTDEPGTHPTGGLPHPHFRLRMQRSRSQGD